MLDSVRSRKLTAHEKFIIEVEGVSRCPDAICDLNREWMEGSVKSRLNLELPTLKVSSWKSGAIIGRGSFESPLLSARCY